MSRYLDPTNDVAFRRIFGNDQKKNILISFLNSVLQLPADRQIKDVTYLDRSQMALLQGMKESILDVQCVDQRGVTYIVEMQVVKPTGFEKRVVYYSAKSYASQMLVGENYPALNQVIFLGILDFKIFDDQHYLSNHKILDTITLKNHLQDLQFCFIELPKFDLTENELTNVVEKWVYFLKNAPKTEAIPAAINEPEIRAAYFELQKFNWSEVDFDAYIRAGILLQDQRGALENKFLEGKAEGKIEGKIETARAMKAEGLPVELIAKITGLSVEEIESLMP